MAGNAQVHIFAHAMFTVGICYNISLAALKARCLSVLIWAQNAPKA